MNYRLLLLLSLAAFLSACQPENKESEESDLKASSMLDNKKKCENSINSSENSKNKLIEHCTPKEKEKESEFIVVGALQGTRFGIICSNDEDDSRVIETFEYDNVCTSQEEVSKRAKVFCNKKFSSSKYKMHLSYLKTVDGFGCDNLNAKIEYGNNFGYRCEDKNGVSAGGAINEAGKCILLDEAIKLAKIECHKVHPSDNDKKMSLVSVQNWGKCDKPVTEGEYGNNFGFRCEDTDGISSGGAINQGGKCILLDEATELARIECDKLHPFTNKQMSLVNVQNWGKCNN